MPSNSTSFRQIYCTNMHCAPEQFASDLFSRAIHRRSLPIALLVYLCGDFILNFSTQSLACFGELSGVTTREAFRKEVEEYRYDVRRQASWWKTNLRLRISGQRLLRYARLLPQ